jgi:acyl carrier protein
MFVQSVADELATAAVRPEIEACVRTLVADHLAVDVGQIAPEVSLVDDLAADSLDLVEVALAIEANLGVSVPFYFLDRIRTYGDLVDATLALVGRRRHARQRDVAVPLRARITPVGAPPPWTLERVVLLTPYAAETLSDDALRAGWGARLELTLPADASDASVARVREQFPRLGDRGVVLDVRREQRTGARRQSAA